MSTRTPERPSASARSPRPTKSCAIPTSASAIRPPRRGLPRRPGRQRRPRARRRWRQRVRLRAHASTSASAARPTSATSSTACFGGGRPPAAAAAGRLVAGTVRCAAPITRRRSSSRSRRRARGGKLPLITFDDGRELSRWRSRAGVRGRSAHPARRRGRARRRRRPQRATSSSRARLRPPPALAARRPTTCEVDLPVAPWEAALGRPGPASPRLTAPPPGSKVPGRLLQRPPPAARPAKGCPCPTGRAAATCAPWPRSSSPRSSKREERKAYQRLAEVSDSDPRSATA